MKQNTVRLTESQLQAVIGTSVKRIINEIAASTLSRAADKGDMWRDEEGEIVSYYDLKNAINQIKTALSNFTNDKGSYFGPHLSETAQKLMGYAGEIEKFFERKETQHNNLEQGAEKKREETIQEILGKIKGLGISWTPGNKESWVDTLWVAWDAVPDEKLDELMSSLSPDARKYLEDEGMAELTSNSPYPHLYDTKYRR